MSITRVSVKQSTTVFVLTAFIFIMGLISYFALPREATPDIKIPYMVITTVYAGVAPEDVESLVTRPIEQELKTLKDVKEITSSSSESVSSIAIEFDPDVDMDYALQRTKDKVDAAKPDLPADVDEPIVTEINFENMPIINIILTADYDLVQLRDVAEDLSDRFETIPGVLSADVTGALEREVQIMVDPARLSQYNLGLGDVTDAITRENVTIPGGTMEIGNFSYSVRVPGEIKNPERFANLVITTGPNGPVYIRDIANVRYGFKERETISRLNGKPSITIGVTKRAGENIIRITDSVKKIIAGRNAAFPHGTHVTIQGDYSKFIRVMVGDLENNIISGFILVVVCIFIFLGLNNSLFIAVSIPLSMLISFIVLRIMGITLNFIVLFSLIMALGMLVDNAIVIVENIYRHRHMGGKNPGEATIEAADEVSMAISSSTLTTVVAFAPMLFWPGIMGEFMKYLPITLIVTLSSSLFVALVINPVLCAQFMKVNPNDVDKFTEGTGFYHEVVMNNYERLLRKAVLNPKSTLGIAFAGLVITILLYGMLGKGVEFFPETDPDAMWIDIKGPVGQRVETTDALTRQIEETAAAFPDVETIVSNVGVSTASSGLGGGYSTSNEARVYMDFLDFEKRTGSSLKTFNEAIPKVKYITGADVSVEKDEGGPPVGEPVEIQISGDDYLQLGRIAKEIERRIKDIPGLVDLTDNFESSKPEISIGVDREKAAALGVNTRDIATAVRTAVNGLDVGDFRVGEDDYDITVRFAERYRKSITDLDRIYVFSEGKQIPLSSVASFETDAGYGTIRHSDLTRVVTVTGSNSGRLANDVLIDVRKRLADYTLPMGYALAYRGQDEEQQDAAQFLGQALLIALFLIAMVLVAQFNSLMMPFIILSSVILSLIGALWGLMLARMPFGIIMTGVGIISLAGVVVNNAIVLLDYTLKLRSWGRSKFDAIIEAGKTRFRPVILTALTTVVGMVPLASGWSFDFHTFRFAAGGSSSQWWAPMAVVIIFGLTFATILTLVVVPSMYMILGRSDEKPDDHK